MRVKPSVRVLILGLSAVVCGVLLRFYAYDLAWPSQWSYSGPRADTVWAIRERTYQDIGMILLGFGFLILLLLIAIWLQSTPHETKG